MVEFVVKRVTNNLIQDELAYRASLVTELYRELDRAMSEYGPFHSAHEGYAVLLEELDEVWDEIKRNDARRTREELVQVGAMVLKFLRFLDSQGGGAGVSK